MYSSTSTGFCNEVLLIVSNHEMKTFRSLLNSHSKPERGQVIMFVLDLDANSSNALIGVSVCAAPEDAQVRSY